MGDNNTRLVSQGSEQVRCMAVDSAAIAAWLLAHVGMIHATHERYSLEIGATLSFREVCHILHMPRLMYAGTTEDDKRSYDYDADQLEYAATVLVNAAGIHRYYGNVAIKTLDPATAFRLEFERVRTNEEGGVAGDPDVAQTEPKEYFNARVAKLITAAIDKG